LDEAPPSTLTEQPSGTPRLAVLSRLVPHKQIEHALDATAALRQTVPDVHLDVIGDGWWANRLVEHATQLGIADVVTFHGHVDDETKHAILQRCWVHVLPSHKEGWALAVTEAAQHAVPTVGYRYSGGLTDSIVDGVTGLLVDDYAQLVEAVHGLLTDDVLRDQLGVKAQARSLEFSWALTTDAIREVLEAVVDGRRVTGVVI
jgi:glycosyltransferase involved in cell wall biosynthesis